MTDDAPVGYRVYALFARTAKLRPDGSVDLTGAFFTGFGAETLPIAEVWHVVGQCRWDDPGQNAYAHTISVGIVPPDDGVVTYSAAAAHQEPWSLPVLADGTMSAFLFGIEVRAQFERLGQYKVAITVDGEQALVLTLDVLGG
jgi:hypothetical protein